MPEHGGAVQPRHQRVDLRGRHEHAAQRGRYGSGCPFSAHRQDGKVGFGITGLASATSYTLFYPPSLPVRGKNVMVWELSAALLTLTKSAELRLVSGLMK